MNLNAHDKTSLSNLRMAKAREFLDDAKANLDDARVKTAVNRSYYAVLSAARSVLILEGANPETHEGTITMLSLRFVKPAILPVELIKKFKILLSRRTDGDYGDFETISTADAEDSVRLATDMIDQIDGVRLELIEGMLNE